MGIKEINAGNGTSWHKIQAGVAICRKEGKMRSLLEKIDLEAYEKEELADMLEDVLTRIQEIRGEFQYELGGIEDMIMEI